MKIKKLLVSAAVILIIISLILFSAQISQEIINGIGICLNTIIPSLFCFTAFSVFLIKTNISEALIYPFAAPLRFLFGVDNLGVGIVVLSLVGGYPVGAALISDAVKEGKLSQQEANRLLCFCVNAGPAFLIGVVGIPILKSSKLGLTIYLSHILACLSVANITRIGKRTNNTCKNSRSTCMKLGDALIYSAKSASYSMLTICSLIILFSAVYAIIDSAGLAGAITSAFKPVFSEKTAEALINGLLEICKGCSKLYDVSGVERIILASGLTAFGGVCVHMQIAAIVNPCGLKTGRYMFYKVIYAVLSVIYTFLLLKIFKIELPVISASASSLGNGVYNHISSAFLVGVCILLLFNFEKSDILKPSKRGKKVRHETQTLRKQD